jgi:hypothetical protein
LFLFIHRVSSRTLDANVPYIVMFRGTTFHELQVSSSNESFFLQISCSTLRTMRSRSFSFIIFSNESLKFLFYSLGVFKIELTIFKMFVFLYVKPQGTKKSFFTISLKTSLQRADKIIHVHSQIQESA